MRREAANSGDSRLARYSNRFEKDFCKTNAPVGITTRESSKRFANISDKNLFYIFDLGIDFGSADTHRHAHTHTHTRGRLVYLESSGGHRSAIHTRTQTLSIKHTHTRTQNGGRGNYANCDGNEENKEGQEVVEASRIRSSDQRGGCLHRGKGVGERVVLLLLPPGFVSVQKKKEKKKRKRNLFLFFVRLVYMYCIPF